MLDVSERQVEKKMSGGKLSIYQLSSEYRLCSPQAHRTTRSHHCGLMVTFSLRGPWSSKPNFIESVDHAWVAAVFFLKPTLSMYEFIFSSTSHFHHWNIFPFSQDSHIRKLITLLFIIAKRKGTISVNNENSLNKVDEMGFPGASHGKEPTCNVGDPDSIPGSGRSPGEGEWQPTPVFLPGKFYGQRNLVGYSPWGQKESNMIECLAYMHIPSF